MSLVEDTACAAIMRERSRRGLVMPRYTPRDWWECDVFELTEAGYFREYEVKLTIADFRRDTDKRREKRPWVFGTPPTWELKHELLAQGDARGPVEFYYVAPVGLIPPTEIPAYAGLIELHDRGSGHAPSWRWCETIVVKAPRIHAAKAPESIRQAVYVCGYHRMHVAFDRLRNRGAPVLEAEK